MNDSKTIPSSSKRVFLIGGGGHANVLSDIIEDNAQTVEGYIIDEKFEFPNIYYKKCLRPSDFLAVCTPGDASIYMAIGSIGDTMTKSSIIGQYEGKGYQFSSIVSKFARVSSSAILGVGVQIMHMVSVGAFVKIGRHVLLNTGCVIEHGVEIGDFTHVAPGAVVCGDVKIGANSHIGANATLVQGVSIGKNCIVGAGAVVIRPVPDNHKAIGVPAKLVEIL